MRSIRCNRNHKIHVAVALSAFVAFCAAMKPAHAAPAELDPGFGTAGLAAFETAANANATGNSDSASDVVQDRAGRILVASRCDQGVPGRVSACLSRMTATGEPHISFGTQGTITSPLTMSGSGAAAEPLGRVLIALQADERIILASTCLTPLGREVFCMARYLNNGAIDSSFGVNGYVNTTVNANGVGDRVSAIRIDSAQRIVLVGTCAAAGHTDACAVRYESSGAPDESFGSGGRLISSFGIPNSNVEIANALAIARNGKLYMAGSCYQAATRFDFCVARFKADGTPDTTFGSAGLARISFSATTTNEVAFAIAEQPDGKLIVAGSCQPSGVARFCLARLVANGTPDSSFDAAFANSGKVETTFPNMASADLKSVHLLPDGRILAVGGCASASGNTHFCAARYQSDGYLDLSFSQNGRFVGAQVAQSAVAAALQSDGKVLIAGMCFTIAAGSSDSCVARLQGGPNTARMCSLDIDGDGVVTTNDSLIWSRIMFGMDARSLDNITFSANATRRSWIDISRFASRQCGVSIGSN
jgi:uncharacterized delta-60 repeat protein